MSEAQIDAWAREAANELESALARAQWENTFSSAPRAVAVAKQKAIIDFAITCRDAGRRAAMEECAGVADNSAIHATSWCDCDCGWCKGARNAGDAIRRRMEEGGG